MRVPCCVEEAYFSLLQPANLQLATCSSQPAIRNSYFQRKYRSVSSSVLNVENLTVSYRQNGRWLDAVRDVDLAIEENQIYGLVGESGSGKSTLALAVMRYLSENGAVRQGSIWLRGRDLTALSMAEMQSAWREDLRLIPQNPLPSLNPSLRIGEQIAETLDPSLSRQEIQARLVELLSTVRLADPERIARAYPHQISGGQQQRVLIAMGLSGEPSLLVMDEPTTNLDVTTEAVILDLLRDLIHSRKTSVLYVTHSLGVVAQLCNRVAVLYAGEVVEDAVVDDIFHQPLHPYTQALLDSVPKMGQNKAEFQLRPIPGQIPELDNLPPGCVFEPRCPLALELCARERPALESPAAGRRVRCHRWQEIADGTIDPRQPAAAATSLASTQAAGAVLEVEGLRKEYEIDRSLLQLLSRQSVQKVMAVNSVDFQIRRHETLGLVGESGSGKSTVARCIIGLIERDGGEICLLDMPLARSLAQRDEGVLRHLQMVLQSPDDALNPYMSVGDALRRPLMRLAGYSRAEAEAGVAQLLTAVKLSPNYVARMPDQLSGGEKQRVAIARAFASQPDLLIFDESVSGLDVSVQAAILNMLNELQQQHRSAYLFISHDLAVVSYLADVIAVIYLGSLMDVGRREQLLAPPYHPYTEALLSAVPVLEPAMGSSAKVNGGDPSTQNGACQPIRLEGEIPSPVEMPSGCPFHTRCHRRPMLPDPEICVREEPPWRIGDDGHRIYCHIPLDELRSVQQSRVEVER
jgi:peptide/nickel transport system ATP-binding protein